MFTSPCSGKKTRTMAIILAMALCLPLCTGALAASVPSAPEGLTAAAGKGQVALIWFEPENDGGAAIIGYQVSIDGGATWTDVGLATTYTYSGLSGDIMYMFMVRAMNSAGNGDGAIITAKPKDGGSSTGQGNQPGQGQGTGGGGGGGGGQQVEPPKPPDTPVKPPDKPPAEPQDKPADEPPPQVEPPQPEDYIPVEIDPAAVAQKPFRPKRAQIKKLPGVYTITVNGTDTQPSVYDSAMIFHHTLNFEASRTSGDILGDYSGRGTFTRTSDNTRFDEWVTEHSGPLSNVRFTIQRPQDNVLAPLAPIGLEYSGKASSMMHWDGQLIKDVAVYNGQHVTENESSVAFNVNYTITIYNNNRAILTIHGIPYVTRTLKYWGSVSRKVKPNALNTPMENWLTPLPPPQPAAGNDNSLSPLPPLLPAAGSGNPLAPLPPTQPAAGNDNSLSPLPPLLPAAGSGNPLAPLPPLQPAAGH